MDPVSSEEAPDYRTFDLRCDHYALGYELGASDPPFRPQAWWAPPADRAFAEACAGVVGRIHPPLLDEVRGYADAQQIDPGELWRLCCRVNLKARVRARSLWREGPGEGCSTFFWPGESYTVVGRNYDYSPGQARRQRIRFLPERGGLPSIGSRGSVPGGRYDGVNARGVWVSLHVVMTDTPLPEAVPPGVPFHLAGRMALELCATAREGRDLLERMPHLSSLNFLIADQEEAFVVEADPRRTRTLAFEAGKPVVATNHFRHADMAGLQGQRPLANSQARCAFLASAAPVDAPVEAALTAAQLALTDRSVPVCGRSGWLTTLWSAVAELRSGRVRYAAGSPDQTPFVEMPPVASRA